MKPVAFDYECPATLDEAVRLLAEAPGAKLLAGGQTLGPMLNLRLARPELLIDVTRIPELIRIEEAGDTITFGACLTHASFEDGLVPDPTRGLLAKVGAGIAYRAVRTRGTIGGSLAHCDPAADWLSCLLALDASVSISGAGGARTIKLAEFARGALASDLAPDEVIDGITISRPSDKLQCGYAKICRKAGEFPHAIGVVAHDVDTGVSRFVVGAVQGPPVVIDGAALDIPADQPLRAPHADGIKAVSRAISERIAALDAYDLRTHAAALARAINQAARP